MGFTFDDTDTKGVATSLAEMQRLIEEDPRNAEVIFPYIGGEEVNDSPTHAHHRYVINFGERDEADVPGAVAGADGDRRGEGEARADGSGQPDGAQASTGGSSVETRPSLHAAIAGLDRVLVTCRHQPQWAHCVPAGRRSVFAESLVVFPLRYATPRSAPFNRVRTRSGHDSSARR